MDKFNVPKTTYVSNDDPDWALLEEYYGDMSNSKILASLIREKADTIRAGDTKRQRADKQVEILAYYGRLLERICETLEIDMEEH